MLKLEFSTDNAAFEGNRDYEICDVLDNIKKRILDGVTSAQINDINGNTITN